MDQYGDKVSIVINSLTDAGLKGYVVKKTDQGVLIVTNVPQNFSSTGVIKEFYEAIWVSGISEKVELGQKIQVWFNGAIASSYPGQAQAEKVEILPSQQHSNAALTEEQVIRQALASKETATINVFVVKSIHFDDKLDAWTIQYVDGFISQNAEVHALQILDK